jgi:hypothetical protein
MTRLIKLVPGSIWRHSTKKLDYLVVGIAKHTDTFEEHVIYRQLYPMKSSSSLKDYQLWSRSLTEFMDYDRHTRINRFEFRQY